MTVRGVQRVYGGDRRGARKRSGRREGGTRGVRGERRGLGPILWCHTLARRHEVLVEGGKYSQFRGRRPEVAGLLIHTLRRTASAENSDLIEAQRKEKGCNVDCQTTKNDLSDNSHCETVMARSLPSGLGFSTHDTPCASLLRANPRELWLLRPGLIGRRYHGPPQHEHTLQ